jgi:hypothetical protein
VEQRRQEASADTGAGSAELGALALRIIAEVLTDHDQELAAMELILGDQRRGAVDRCVASAEKCIWHGSSQTEPVGLYTGV